MVSDKEKNIFLSFFNEEKLNSEECIRNYKNKKVVFYTEIDGNGYYIKKYIPYNRRKYTIGLGLKEDLALHYKTISDKLKKLNIPHVEPYFIEVKKYSLFNRASIVVTKDGGTTLEKYRDDYKNHLEWFKYFFDTFIFLTKNKIYCTDYNPDGLLIGKDGKLRFIDFDAYKTKFVLTKKFRKYLISNLGKIYVEGKDEFNEYCKNEINRVVKELGWEKYVNR